MSIAEDADALSRLAYAHLGEDLGRRWSGLLAPAARLTGRPGDGRLHRGRSPGTQGVGWLGGVPTMPASTAWPVWEGHGPLAHVATLDCAQLYAHLPDRLREAGFPTEGLLSFFYFDGSIDGGVEVVGALFGTEDGARVCYTPASVAVEDLTPPAPLTPYPRVELTAETVLTWPDRNHPDLPATPLSDLAEGLYTAVEEIERRHPGPLHQVGGNPFPVQGPVEFEVSYGQLSEGGSVELDWSDPAVEQGARGWLLLAQFDSDDTAGFMWGDGGVLYFLIRPESLARRAFDETAFTWQCS